VAVGSTARDYIIKFPSDYSAARPYPLVFGFHGAKYSAEWVANGEDPLTGPYFGMESEAKAGAIFVAPQASGTWSSGDIEFVQTMVDAIKTQACVDESRIFASGFSMGAIMTARIGCVLPDVFRAVAPMSASLPSECDGSTFPPLPYLGTHGTLDQTISISQGMLVRDSYVARNGCDTSLGMPNEHGCSDYAGCDEGYPTRFCTFEGEHVPFPHAGVEIWQFFSQF
jgi:poly(3-hydroxybutyrate) depolymerase